MIENNRIYRKRWFYSSQLILDTFIVLMSFYIGFRLQRPEIFSSPFPRPLSITLLYIGMISIVIFSMLKTNECGIQDFASSLFYTLLGMAIIVFLSVIVDFVIKGIGIWRQTIFWSVLIQIISFFIIKLIFYRLHKIIIKPLNVIIIGTSKEDLLRLFSMYNQSSNNSYIVKQLIKEDAGNLYESINQYNRVIVSDTCETEKKKGIIEHCAIKGIDCMILPNLTEIIINGGRFANLSDVLLLSMDIKLDLETRIIKRCVDIIISGISLVILLPVIAVVSVLIKIQDGGKVIFSQERVTRENRIFVLHKFRTMIENAEEQTGAVLAKADDERITKLGVFLRKYRLDEIPQLLNVFLGDMSLIGPRPERKELIDRIVVDTPEFKYRTIVKAGLTGLAQTKGKYTTPFNDKLRFDLYYINNYSLFLDLQIMFYTLLTLLTPSAASGVEENANQEDLLKDKGFLWIEQEQSFIIER